MKLNKLLVSISVGAAALAVGLAAFMYRSASAATPTPVAEDAAAVQTDTTMRPEHGRGGRPGEERGGQGLGYSDEDLASALGVSVDDLSAARQEAYQAGLAQALEQGLITQTQADELATDGEAFPMGGRWQAWLSENGIDFQALFAEALGITVEQLEEAKTQAFNAQIDQAVTDGTLTQEQADLMKGQRALQSNDAYQASMQAAYEAAVEQAVADGVITQAQADQLLANAETGRFGPHGEMGGAKGFRRP